MEKIVKKNNYKQKLDNIFVYPALIYLCKTTKKEVENEKCNNK